MMKLRIEPLTTDRWPDLVELFARPGASVARSCYCMAYRRTGRLELPPGQTYAKTNQAALKALVDRGVVVSGPLQASPSHGGGSWRSKPPPIRASNTSALVSLSAAVT